MIMLRHAARPDPSSTAFGAPPLPPHPWHAIVGIRVGRGDMPGGERTHYSTAAHKTLSHVTRHTACSTCSAHCTCTWSWCNVACNHPTNGTGSNSTVAVNCITSRKVTARKNYEAGSVARSNESRTPCAGPLRSSRRGRTPASSWAGLFLYITTFYSTYIK